MNSISSARFHRELLYIEAGQYDRFGKLKKAIFNAWADKQKAGYRERSFGDIVGKKF